MTWYVVDRIEDGFAMVSQDGMEGTLPLSLSLIDGEVYDGAVLFQQDSHFVVNPDAEKKLREATRSRLNTLFSPPRKEEE